MDNFTVQAAEVRDYGEDGAQYFPGVTAINTDWQRVMLGAGDTAREALENALEQMSLDGAQLSLEQEDALFITLANPDKRAHDSLDEHDCDAEDSACHEWQHYIAVFYNLKPET